MGIIQVVKSLLPSGMRAAVSRALFPYRHGNRFFQPYVIRDKSMEGQTFDFFVGDRTGRNWYDRPCINNPVWREMQFVRDRMVSPGDVILEVGGHHGCSAILLSRWVGPAGKVLTFEPLLENFTILEENVRLNRLENVVPRQVAVGSAPGTILFDTVASGIAHAGTPVAVIKLDEYVHLRPTFIKIDVEGFELDVLRGMPQILATRPKLALEIHADLLARYDASVQQVLSVVGLEHYETWVQWHDDEAPVPYGGEAITHRAHLFCLPHT